MLREIPQKKHKSGASCRRWFADNLFDLIIWYLPDNSISGFQLCYREGHIERALTWLKNTGFSHNRVDDGEGRPDRHKMSPVLVPDGVFDKKHIHDLFKAESKNIRPDIVRLILRTINKYPE